VELYSEKDVVTCIDSIQHFRSKGHESLVLPALTNFSNASASQPLRVLSGVLLLSCFWVSIFFRCLLDEGFESVSKQALLVFWILKLILYA
jgi:hypothetical protein